MVIWVPVPLTVMKSGFEVTVYELIAPPPFELGGVKFIMAEASPATALTAVGALGRVIGVTPFDAIEAGPLPTWLVANTVKA